MESAETDSIFLDHENQMSLVTKDIEEIMQKKAHYISTQNKLNWLQYGEKNSSYFFNLEKDRKRSPITAIQVGQNKIDCQDEILEQLRFFYQKLFRTKLMNLIT